MPFKSALAVTRGHW